MPAEPVRFESDPVRKTTRADASEAGHDGRAVTLARGIELFRQGDPSESVFLIDRGIAKLMRQHEDGAESIVALRGPGRFLGATAALMKRDHVLSAMTVTPCRLRRFGRDEFHALVQCNSVLSWRLHELHCHELDESMVRMAEIGSLSARARLKCFLSTFAAWVGSPSLAGPVKIPLRQWEIAQLVSVTPQYLCQMLTDLERQGVVRRDRHRLVYVWLERFESHHRGGDHRDSGEEEGSGSGHGDDDF